MIKIVYFIVSYKNPEQVCRLIRALLRGSANSEIVVHHDYSKSYLDHAIVEKANNVHIMRDYVSVRWGDFSLVSTILCVIEWIIQHLKFDYLVLISGQDYPIQPLRQIEHFLETTNYDGFLNGVSLIEAVPCGPVECPIASSKEKVCTDCLERYYYQYYKMPNVPYYNRLPTPLRKSLRRIRNFLDKNQSICRFRSLPAQRGGAIFVGIRSLKTPFTSDFACYKGSLWFTLNYGCIEFLHRFSLNNPQFIRYYKRTILPDESFFHTILLNDPRMKILRNNKRFISWSSFGSPSPDILRIQDFDRIIASDQHFARKFDINVDAEILNMIDQHIK